MTTRQRRVAAALADGAAWIIGIVVAVVVRFEFVLTLVGAVSMVALALVAATMQVTAGQLLARYRGRFSYGSFDEVRALSIVVAVQAAVLAGMVILLGPVIGLPRGTVILAFPFVLVLMLAIRFGARIVRERSRKPGHTAEPTLIVGAGHVSDVLLHDMTTDPASPLRAVGILDDDPAKHNLRLRGIPVIGRTTQIVEAARETGATSLVIAIGGADSTLLRRLADDAETAGLRVRVIPTLANMMSDEQNVVDLRDISIEDLIGRHPVDTNVELIAGYVTGRRVLVTGAGGSIGAELCRQLAQFGPQELIMLDRDETGLQVAQLATSGRGLLDTRDVVLADIREERTLLEIFADRRPEVVFHAAALKHLPMLEQYPDEAWKTNVLGTLNVLNAARLVGVDTFVNISTDKAAEPTSVLGHSKRVAERLTAWAGEETGMRYLSVRFGNVIGSRGSMLPTFRALIAAGGPVTVTHPDVTRYFMTIPEACQLVIQAGGIGRPGEILILDMGEPVSILEVAKRMIAMSGSRIDIVFTGLRQGEKLHEVLVGADETLERPFHPHVAHTRAEAISPDELDRTEWEATLLAVPRGDGAATVGAPLLSVSDLGPR